MAEEEDQQQQQQAFEIDDRNDVEEPGEARKKISPANWVNIGAFVLNAAISYTAEFTKAFGTSLHEADDAYVTILTPRHSRNNGESFLIWHAIFAWQLVFVIVQILPAYREDELVRQITPWWIMVNFTQIAWTLTLTAFFGSEMRVMIGGLIMLNFVWLIILIGRIETRGLRKAAFYLDPRPVIENWLLRVPFSIHAGYLLCLSIMYLNSMLQLNPKNRSDGPLVATSMTGITAVLFLTAVFTMAVPRPDGFFPIGVSWFFFYVAQELETCGLTGQDQCALRRLGAVTESEVSSETLQAFAFAAYAVAYLAGCMSVLAFLLRGASCLQRNRVQ